jgi:isopentenyl diphosphate isomerase/L-lactate dehydrogenase-like FMN-dependent dehydrogenase
MRVVAMIDKLSGFGAPLTSVADAERLARRCLPTPVFQTMRGGRGAGVSVRENVEAFSRIGFVPRICQNVTTPDASVTVMDTRISQPVLLSPAGVHGIHPDGEVAVARAARAEGTLFGLSAFASRSIEEVVAAHPGTMGQVYWLDGRDFVQRHLDRLKSAGVEKIILTLDWSHQGSRDWKDYPMPTGLDARTIARYLPFALMRPTWLFRWAAAGKLPLFDLPNILDEAGRPGSLGHTLSGWIDMAPPTWDDMAWLRDRWHGHLVLKGILHPEDAARAAEIGADAISVSNHGGNDLDGALPPLRALPDIVSAVGGRLDVLLDGGVRRGSDVARALALGAKAVMVGRPYLWALGARGEKGVQEVLRGLKREFERTMAALGVSLPAELNRSHLVDLRDGAVH